MNDLNNFIKQHCSWMRENCSPQEKCVDIETKSIILPQSSITVSVRPPLSPIKKPQPLNRHENFLPPEFHPPTHSRSVPSSPAKPVECGRDKAAASVSRMVVVKAKVGDDGDAMEQNRAVRNLNELLKSGPTVNGCASISALATDPIMESPTNLDELDKLAEYFLVNIASNPVLTITDILLFLSDLRKPQIHTKTDDKSKQILNTPANCRYLTTAIRSKCAWMSSALSNGEHGDTTSSKEKLASLTLDIRKDQFPDQHSFHATKSQRYG